MRFQVPQFIEIEDKIFGPLTLKQFIYVAGGAGVVILAFTFLPKFLAVIASAPFALLGVALAFYKPNNRPFIYTLESIWYYSLGEKLYVWKKRQKETTTKEKGVENSPLLQVPHLSESKLKDMNWNLDVKKEEENDKTGV